MPSVRDIPTRARRCAPLLVSAGLALSGLAVARSDPTTAGVPAASPSFLTTYSEPVNADYGVVYAELRRQRFLESVADALNRQVVLAPPVTLKVAECGHSTTSWSAETRTITVCYEFLDAAVVLAGEAGVSPARTDPLVAGAVTFALFGEVGNVLIGAYGLPAPRGSAAAGDEFAALTLAAVERNGDTAATMAIEFFDAVLGIPDSGFEYLEDHAFDRARLENVACIVYGLAPGNHPYVLERGLIATARLPHCAEEAGALARMWDAALREHARPADPPPVPPATAAPAQRP